MATLATRKNMRAYETEHPGRELPGGGYVEPRRAVAYSPTTGEEYSATSGDYFWLPDDEPLTDAEGEPMILVEPYYGVKEV